MAIHNERIELSIIYVNYNVKYLLAQSIESVRKSVVDTVYEIIVFDNNSSDGSGIFFQRNFPTIDYIASKDNLGFSKANNLAIDRARGEYVLLLNPDTVILDDAIQSGIALFKSAKDIGVVGLAMLDGARQFLPESKRGLPTPSNSLYKLTGLSALFPKSQLLSSYYMGHIPTFTDSEVDVLTGAFMLMERSQYQALDGLDEAFFMYGEDVDLSFRIQKTGKQVYYKGSSQIIHYKGQSTNKYSFSYFKSFYNAMLIFFKKHQIEFSNFYRLIVPIGIYISAIVSGMVRMLQFFAWPIVDFILFVITLFGIAGLWSTYYHGDADYFASAPLSLMIPLASLVWVFIFGACKSYFGGLKLKVLIRSAVIAFLITGIIYGLLNLEYRFSRSVLVIGSLMSFTLSIMLKYLWYRIIKPKSGNKAYLKKRRILCIASKPAVASMDDYFDMKKDLIHWNISVLYEAQMKLDQSYFDHLNELIELELLNELVLNFDDFNNQEINTLTSKLNKSMRLGLFNGSKIVWIKDGSSSN